MKNFLHFLPAMTFLPAPACQDLAGRKSWQAGAGRKSRQAAATVASFIFSFIWLQACSQSPAPNAGAQQSNSILSDTAGTALGNSPDKEYRLFKFNRIAGDHTETNLKILRLKDLQEAMVSSVIIDAPATEPKFFWSKDSKYLVVDNSVPDSIYKREVLLYNLQELTVAQRNPGALIAFDAMNEVVFFYRTSVERQTICFYDLAKPGVESVRDIIAPPVGKMPTVIFSYKERNVKVKAYTTDNVPVNVVMKY